MSAGPYVSDDQIVAVLDVMGDDALNLKEACEQADLSYGNIRRRIQASESLKALHAYAREEYAQSKVQDMYRIIGREPDVARARLVIDTIKWEVARVLPKVYGDKLETTHTGTLTVESIRRTIVDPTTQTLIDK